MNGLNKSKDNSDGWHNFNLDAHAKSHAKSEDLTNKHILLQGLMAKKGSWTGDDYIHKDFEYELTPEEKRLIRNDLEARMHFREYRNNLGRLSFLSKKMDFHSDTLVTAIITLFSGSMGGVMLSLPKAFSVYGVIFGSIVSFVFALNMLISAIILSVLSAKHQDCDLYSE